MVFDLSLSDLLSTVISKSICVAAYDNISFFFMAKLFVYFGN